MNSKPKLKFNVASLGAGATAFYAKNACERFGMQPSHFSRPGKEIGDALE